MANIGLIFIVIIIYIMGDIICCQLTHFLKDNREKINQCRGNIDEK